jgi:hypothetical protein
MFPPTLVEEDRACRRSRGVVERAVSTPSWFDGRSLRDLLTMRASRYSLAWREASW